MFDMSSKEVPPADQLKKMIWQALDNAVENGEETFVMKANLELVACDLHDNDADLEGIDTANFEEHIVSWREARNK